MSLLDLVWPWSHIRRLEAENKVLRIEHQLLEDALSEWLLATEWLANPEWVECGLLEAGMHRPQALNRLFRYLADQNKFIAAGATLIAKTAFKGLPGDRP